MNVCLWHVLNTPRTLSLSLSKTQQQVWGMKYDGNERDVIIMLPFFIHSMAFAKVITNFFHTAANDLCVCQFQYVLRRIIKNERSPPRAQLRALAIRFISCSYYIHGWWRGGRGWWMNVDVIKQFSVCLKVCNFQPLPHRHLHTGSKLLPFTRHENKNYFPIFLSCHPPFFSAKDNCQGWKMKKKNPVASSRRRRIVFYFVSVVFGTIFFYICMSIFSLFPLSKFILRLHKTSSLFFILHNSPSSIPHSKKK